MEPAGSKGQASGHLVREANAFAWERRAFRWERRWQASKRQSRGHISQCQWWELSGRLGACRWSFGSVPQRGRTAVRACARRPRLEKKPRFVCTPLSFIHIAQCKDRQIQKTLRQDRRCVRQQCGRCTSCRQLSCWALAFVYGVSQSIVEISRCTILSRGSGRG